MEKWKRMIRDTPNRGDTHVFLGDPHSDGCDKTTVEPGNGFSPGVWTCGVSVWAVQGDTAVSVDTLPDTSLRWGFAEGTPPVLRASLRHDELTMESFLCHLGGPGAEGADFLEVHAAPLAGGLLAVAVRDCGPAGGKIEAMEWRSPVLLVNGGLRITFETPPERCEIHPPDEGHDSPFALALFEAGEARRIRLRAEHAFTNRPGGDLLPLTRPFEGVTVQEAFSRARAWWEEALPARVYAPDGRVGRVFEREAHHILAAMECSLPRIGAVNYPAFWMRDGVILLRALDLIGRGDLARPGCDALAPLLFAGGFGAESDAPGEAIWALVSHARMSGDLPWLRDVYPMIVKRADLIERMRTAREPIYAVGENRMPRYQFSPGVNLLCLPATNGCIHGRMDWHSPDFFINCWAIGGLASARDAAQMLGMAEDARRWESQRGALEEAVRRTLLPLYGNDRDPVIAPYPSGAFAGSAQLRQQFEDWYRAHRLTPGGARSCEPLWTYFEAVQAHNAILLGLRELAWTSLGGMLESEDWNDVSAFVEGEPGGNEFLNFHGADERRGWLDPGRAKAGNMPHNWTAAELVNCIRDLFVCEEPQGLALGRGVPKDWLLPGCRFGVKNLPTAQGTVTYDVQVAADGALHLDYHGPQSYRTDFGRTPE